jgi:uncharacterized MAPEG superfamily protein
MKLIIVPTFPRSTGRFGTVFCCSKGPRPTSAPLRAPSRRGPVTMARGKRMSRQTTSPIEDHIEPLLSGCRGFPKWGLAPDGQKFMENTMEIDDLGVPLFQETSMFSFCFLSNDVNSPSIDPFKGMFFRIQASTSSPDHRIFHPQKWFPERVQYIRIYLSIHPSIHPTIYLSFLLSIYLSYYLSIYLFAYVYVCVRNLLHTYCTCIFNVPNLRCMVFICGHVGIQL